MESIEVPQQLTGVVIITLPPPDNPSLGKTITAFTLTDDDDSLPTPSQEPHQTLPIQSPPDPQLQFSLQRSLFGSPRTVLGLLGISLIALVFWVSSSPETLFQLRSSNDDDKPKSFVFPLYHKLGIGDNIELKLERFVEFRELESFNAPLNDEIRHRKMAKLKASAVSDIGSTTVLPIMGNIYPDGLYYTHMFFGHPPRPYFLDVDTGSDLTWIQCDAPCTSCAKGAHPFYKPTKANLVPTKDSLCTEIQRRQRTEYCETCHQCDYEIEYADHSSSIGVLARDELLLSTANGSWIKSDVVFGCAYDQQGLLLNSLAKTDGIIGLSKAKLSLSSQLASQGIIENVVGHCLATDVTDGGYMFFGNDFVPYRQMAWTPMLNSPSMNFYDAEIIKLSYGSRQLSVGGEKNGLARVVFDTGSSYTYFPEKAYSELVALLKGMSAAGLVLDESDPTFPICWQSKLPLRSVKDVNGLFRPLTLQFGSRWWVVSTKLKVPPEGYLILSKKGNVCLGILDGSKFQDGSTVIVGDVSLRGQLVVYDNVNKRIGWTQSNCVAPQGFKTFPFF